jgi:hypothetical protein
MIIGKLRQGSTTPMHTSHLRLLLLSGVFALFLLALLSLPDTIGAAYAERIPPRRTPTPALPPTSSSASLATRVASSARHLRTPAALETETEPQQYVPALLTIEGPHDGVVAVSYRFTATVRTIAPETNSPTTRFIWQAPQQPTLTQTATVSDAVTFAWETPGPRTLTLTVINDEVGVISTTHQVTIRVPPQNLALAAPAVGALQQPVPFIATTNPTTTTTPLTYTWQASGAYAAETVVSGVLTGSPVITTTGNLTSALQLTWQITGPQTLTVSATNGAGTITTTALLDIRVPPATLDLAAPITGTLDTPYEVTAAVQPMTTTTPLHYRWQTQPRDAMTQQRVTTSTGTISDTVSFTWSERGVQAITTTATNASGTVTATRALIAVFPPPTSTTMIVTPAGGEVLVSSDGVVEIAFAKGSVKEPAVAIYTRLADVETLPPGLDLAYGFELESYSTRGTGLEVACCDPAASATIAYATQSTQAEPGGLRLLMWNGQRWLDVPSVVDTRNQQVGFEVAAPTQLALVRELPSTLFLPVLRR